MEALGLKGPCHLLGTGPKVAIRSAPPVLAAHFDHDAQAEEPTL